jgi:sugar/nucleoside kinase (ribokinase family)
VNPQLLVAGHIVKDVQTDGWVAGGGALYAAAQAARLGIDTAVVTACAPDVDPARLLPDVAWHVRPVEESIRFENVYAEGARSQRVLSTAPALTLDDVPTAWRETPLILLTPVFHDVDPTLPSQLSRPGVLVGLTAQGWLRRLDGDRVVAGAVEALPSWLCGDAVFLSEEDVLDPDAVEAWRSHVPAVVLTRGRAGCTLWDAAGRHDLAPVPACEHDPTGAGDVFATAYLVRFSETGDALTAARFAAAAAALAVEGEGVSAIGDRARIEARLARSGGA